jgi:hypothetical protein
MSLRKEFVDWKKNIWVKSLLEEEEKYLTQKRNMRVRKRIYGSGIE